MTKPLLARVIEEQGGQSSGCAQPEVFYLQEHPCTKLEEVSSTPHSSGKLRLPRIPLRTVPWEINKILFPADLGSGKRAAGAADNQPSLGFARAGR